MALPPPIVATPLTARRFLRRALALDAPHPDLATALAYHGYVQIDPINICGRMHDLILRNRVADYREGDLMRFLHGDAPSAPDREADTRLKGKLRPTQNGQREPLTAPPPRPLPAEARRAFEHHAPDTDNLAAFPLEAWPYLQAEMRVRSKRTGAWSGRLTPRERELAPQLLAEIAARGPLGSEDFADERRAHRIVWGAASLVKSTLQKLFFHGRVLIAQRASNRRRYDLPERVLPASVLARTEASAGDTARWLAQLKLRQRRLALLKRDELRVIEDLVQPVVIEHCPPLFCLREDAPLLATMLAGAKMNSVRDPSIPGSLAPTAVAGNLAAGDDAIAQTDASARSVALLAPLDPLIYDRRLTAALWNFDYTWEAYTPPRKRVRGYYALPVLIGTEIVGHVDPKADRSQRRLTVVSRRIQRGHKVAPALREFARWLGLRAK